MTDNQKIQQFGEAFRKCVDKSVGEGHKFVKVSASSDTPHPDSPFIELRSLPHIPSWAEASLAGEVNHQEFRRPHTAYTHVVTVPIPVVEEWKRRIAQLEREINAHGLRFEAVISNPGDPWMATPGEPATLHGKPLVCKTKARHGMTIGADYFGMEGPTPSELHQMQEQELAAILEEQGPALAEHLDRREAAKMEGKLQIEPGPSPNDVELKVFPYLQESVYIPSCPVIGKQPAETIDLSEESI